MIKNKETEHSLYLEIEKETDEKDKKKKLLEIQENIRARVFLRLHATTQKEILTILKRDEILHLLKLMDPDEVTDVLQKISNEKKRGEILEELQEETKHKVEFLLRFHPETAAGLMSLDYIVASAKQTLSAVNKLVIKHEKRTGKFPTILVEEEGEIIGELPGHYLTTKTPKEKIKKHIIKIHTVNYDESQREIIKKFRETRHNKIIVMDDTRFALGIIYSDDILRLIQDEPDKSLYSFAGLRREETINDTIKEKVKYRYKWLIVSLIASFVVAATILPFEQTLDRMVILAVYLPIVAMMGGNAATQTLAVVIRGLTLNQISTENAKKIILKEISAGTINGIITGILVGIISIILSRTIMFGVVIGLAMIFNLFIAGLFGSLIPLTIKRLGKDPASSAIMFIITATDIFGFFTFLGLATLLL
jgi:magnesium transporter